MTDTRSPLCSGRQTEDNQDSGLDDSLVIKGLQQASRNPCLLTDTRLVVHFCNHAARTTLGPLLQRPIRTGVYLCDIIKEAYRKDFDNAVSLAERGEVHPLEIVVREASDTVLNLSLEIVPVRQTDGSIAAYCVNIFDHTAAHRAEKALRDSLRFSQAVIKHSPIGVSVRDRHGRLLSANPAWARIWNYDENDIRRLQAEQKHALELDERDTYLGPWQQKVREIYQKGGELFIPEIQLTGRRSLNTRWISHYFYAIHDDESRVDRVVILTEDLTERKHHEQERGQAHRMEMLGLLAGGIAHGFNNVLQGFLGHVALAKDDIEEDREAWHHLSVAERVAEQANHLTQQLLTFAKGGEPVRQPTNTAELITDSVSVALGSSAVTVSFDFEPGLPQIDVDNGQIGRAVQNITVNAVQAMPEGGRVNVSVKTHRLPDSVTDSALRGKSYVRVRISDQGQGIPPDEIHRVWDPYYSTREGHSGLGLTAAYAIVSKHDGVLHINSQPAKGTVVDMWLPACDRSSEDSIDLDQLDPRGSERILVMDDEDFIRSLMDKALSRYGYQVTVASDGEASLKLYEQAKANSVPFDLVILDLVVANGMGGQETMKELKRLDPSVMALVCSGYSADPIMANYRQHGFAGVVRKPFRPKSLAQAVRHHCDLAKEGRRI